MSSAIGLNLDDIPVITEDVDFNPLPDDKF